MSNIFETSPINSAMYRSKVRNGKFKIKKIPFPKFKGDEPCTRVHPDTMYPEIIHEGHSVKAAQYARQVCEGCPMKMPCLEWALYHEKDGIWGGTTSTQRKAIRNEMKIAMVDPRHIDIYLSYEKEYYSS